jgi:hypothetical protein
VTQNGSTITWTLDPTSGGNLVTQDQDLGVLRRSDSLSCRRTVVSSAPEKWI